ncbi:MAG TPA: transglutaminase domain-containing protein, partial [Candidatus Merdenecus merdavium]|nr:transglutaminase domain-containing protein [Candidatus Merdenecus merdavium]
MEKKIFLKDYRDSINRVYQQLELLFPVVFEEIHHQLEGLDENITIALKYLYTAMPYSDIGNYPFETYLSYARHGVFLWENKKEVQDLPEEIYLNYVLHYRVNEEEILPCRELFYEQIQNTVQENNGIETILDVNYWCAGEVTYQTTDDRTLSALATYERGSGRCGEESVFAVNAFRSVGIPSRQVYAPWWSHCDDNHAWVEVWHEGEWYFLGACEPEAVLNRG